MGQPAFTIDDLMALLIAKAGLPRQASTDNPQWTFADVGLDSLAYLQLQAELQARFGVEIPTEKPLAYTFGEIVGFVNDNAASGNEVTA